MISCRAYNLLPLLTLLGSSLGVILPSFALPTNKTAVTLQGRCEYAVYQGRTNALFTSTHNWQLTIADCCWEISYVDTEALTNSNKPNLGASASCDARDIYVTYSQNAAAIRKAMGKNGNLPAATATIYSGAYPPPTEPVLQRIWLPFASKCLLGNEQGVAKPPFIVDMAIFNSTNYSCQYYWVEGQPNSPLRKLIFRSHGSYFGRNSQTGELLNFTLSQPFDKGYLMAEGDWLRSTNIAGYFLPTEFNFRAFVPNSGSTAGDLLLSFQYRCVVTNVCVSTIPPFPAPPPSRTLFVSDRRFADRGYAFLDYTITNGHWSSREDGALLAKLRYTPKISPEDEAQVPYRPPTLKLGSTAISNPKPLARALLLCSVLVPLAIFGAKFLWLQKAKNKHKWKGE